MAFTPTAPRPISFGLPGLGSPLPPIFQTPGAPTIPGPTAPVPGIPAGGVPGVPTSDPGGDVPTGSGGGGIDWGSILSAIPGLIASGAHAVGNAASDAVPAALVGLAGFQALQAGKASARASGFQDKAISQAEGRWNDAAPFRSRGTAGLLNPVHTDLSNVVADPTNPFFTPTRRPLTTSRRVV